MKTMDEEFNFGRGLVLEQRRGMSNILCTDNIFKLFVSVF
jgi:hypothetical protein